MSDPLHPLVALINQNDRLRWLFAGDSITQGALHTMGWRDYTELFAERTRWEMQRMRDCVINTAVSGWRVSSILHDLQWSILQHRPDVLLVNIGMNDCVAGLTGVAEFQHLYLELIQRVREKSDPIIVIQTPNQILPSDALRAPHLPDYANAARTIAQQTGSIVIDHFQAWEPWRGGGTLALLLSDALHPNECGHRLMARTLLSGLGMWDGLSRVGRLFVP